MPTVVDQLVLELGLNPAGFTQGQKDALDTLRKMQEELDKGGKQVDAQGKKIGEYFNRLKGEAMTLLAGFFGGKGAKEFLVWVNQNDAAVGRLSKTLNISSEALSIWQGIFKQSGASVESANSALQGLSTSMNTFMITGQGPFLGVFTQLGLSLFDANNKLKTADVMLTEIGEKVNKLNPEDKARAAANLSLIPGMNQDAINVLLQGSDAMKKLYEDQVKLGVITKENVENATQLTKAWNQAEIAATSWGRSIVNYLTPALVTFLNRWRDIFIEFKNGHGISPDSVLGRALGLKPMSKSETIEGAKPSPSASFGDALKKQAIEGYIREAAVKRGIDPEVAVKVWKSEGANAYVGDRGSSFGPFQLHYGGVASGGMAVGGLGDEFTKKTGLNARDPSTVQQQIDFALDEAKRSGWGAWHGWKGTPFAGISRGGAAGAAEAASRGSGAGSTVTSQTTVGTVVVNTQSTDAAGIARDIKAALERQSFAGSANYGQH